HGPDPRFALGPGDRARVAVGERWRDPQPIAVGGTADRGGREDRLLRAQVVERQLMQRSDRRNADFDGPSFALETTALLLRFSDRRSGVHRHEPRAAFGFRCGDLERAAAATTGTPVVRRSAAAAVVAVDTRLDRLAPGSTHGEPPSVVRPCGRWWARSDPW